MIEFISNPLEKSLSITVDDRMIVATACLENDGSPVLVISTYQTADATTPAFTMKITPKQAEDLFNQGVEALFRSFFR